MALDQANSPISDIKKRITLEEAGFRYGQDVPDKLTESMRQQKYLSTIYQVNQTITEIFDLGDLSRKVLDLIFQIFSIDRAAVILCDNNAETLNPVAFKAKEIADKTDSFTISQTVIRKVVLERSAVLATDTYLDARFKDVTSIMRKHIRAVMCVPLHTRGKILGALYADALEVPGRFSDDDLRLLFAVGGALANAVENVLLIGKIKEEERKLGTLERYLPSAVVEFLLNQPDSARLGGQHASISVLFADIRGFTPLAERIAPADVVFLLNEYFSSMSEVVFEHGGTLGEYIGDEIMAYFGVPIQRGDHARCTISVAFEMRERMMSLKERLNRRALPSFDIGIGIATGTVIAGNVGSAKQMKYTVIGNTVNLAHRLCSAARPGQILVSSETYRAAGSPGNVRFFENILLKGISRPVETYEVEQCSTS
ncbi:MAG: GAF domain-containing protein [Candidatus Lindowbacteria bacterium]|nr:GAF domain-containing protein [Candidatus Lindowbacteria bacterium]